MQIQISWLLQKPSDLNLHCKGRVYQSSAGLGLNSCLWHLKISSHFPQKIWLFISHILSSKEVGLQWVELCLLNLLESDSCTPLWKSVSELYLSRGPYIICVMPKPSCLEDNISTFDGFFSKGHFIHKGTPMQYIKYNLSGWFFGVTCVSCWKGHQWF